MTTAWVLPKSISRPSKVRWWNRQRTTYAVSLCQFDGCDDDATTDVVGPPLCHLHASLFSEPLRPRLHLVD